MKLPRWLPNLLLAVGSLVFFAGAAEWVARAVDLRPAGGSATANPAWLGDRVMLRNDYREEMAKAGVLSRYYELYEWDRYLFYRLRPDVDIELLDVFAPPAAREKSRWRVRTNSRGFRTPEFADAPAPGTVRIAVLGDSSTFGWGVDAADTYPAQLGPALAKRWGVDPSRVEILNLGVPGYSSFQGRVLLERVALGYLPDAVVWSYLSNDGALTGESDQTSYAQRLGPSGALLAALHRSRAFEALEAWIAVLRARWQPPAPLDPTDDEQRNVPSYRAAGVNVIGAVTLAQDAGIPIVLLGQCTRALPAEVMASVARNAGALHLDATGLLDAAVPTLRSDAGFAEWRAHQLDLYGRGELEPALARVPAGPLSPERGRPPSRGRRARRGPRRRAARAGAMSAPVPATVARGAFLALLGCFFLSGFAALLYQTAWTREFGAVFGTSELAVATVLAAYMGGLACGAAIAGRVAARVRRPVFVYGLLELGVALSALAVPLAIRAATALEIALLGGRELPADAGGLASAGFYLLCAFAILLVPTTFMGATLPLLARHAVRSDREVGPRIGALYAVNTAGAIGGTLVCGFALLPALGLRGTVWVGVAGNALVFALAAAVARRAPDTGRASEATAARGAVAAPLPRAAWILPIVLLSGAASFSYEVLWTRLLGHVLGGSIYAFATMLASVLAGIAAGGAIGARIATSPARAARGFAVAQLATAALALAAFRALDFAPALAGWLGAGGRGDVVANAALAMAILVPPALAIGTTFPFAVRVLARGSDDAGPASARVYAWNTMGAIAGAVLAGFVVLPALGYAGTLVAACGANLLLALAAALLYVRGRALPALAAAGVLALALFAPGEPWRLLLASPLGAGSSAGAVTQLAVGRAATVLVLRHEGRHDLRTNGLPEASIETHDARPGSELVAQWLTALPAAARPGLRNMLVVGLGGGLALEHVPATVEAIDVVELEPEVLRANQRLAAWRGIDPLADPRVRVRTNDARSALLLTDQRYDAIVSQPSHPWGAGASHLYTREFFTLVRDRLDEGGVFVQWIGLAFVDEELLRSLLATLRSVFPHVRAYRPGLGGVLFLASAAPLDVEQVAGRAIAAAPARFAAVGIVCAEDLAALLALDDAGTAALAAGAELSTDDRNVLATRSPRVLAAPLGARGATRLFAKHEPLIPLATDLDAGYVVRRIAAIGLPDRAQRVAAAIADPARRLVAEASLALRGNHLSEAERLAREASALDPNRRDARAIALAAGDPDVERAAEAGELGAGALAFARAGRAAALAAPDWESVRALDGELAAIDPRSPLAPGAVRLRARWRLASNDPAVARAGLAILDGLLPRFRTRADLRLRAQLAEAAGAIPGALSTWMELATSDAPAERAAAAATGIALARSTRAAALGPEERDAWVADFESAARGATKRARR